MQAALDDDFLIEHVREFVALASPVPLERISLESGLDHDLGIDDPEYAAYFFAEFARKFDVDLVGLDIRKHIGLVWTSWGWLFFIIALPLAGLGHVATVPLPIVIGFPLVLLWLGNRLEDRIQHRNSYEIRVKDLVHAANSKCWQKKPR